MNYRLATAITLALASPALLASDDDRPKVLKNIPGLNGVAERQTITVGGASKAFERVDSNLNKSRVGTPAAVKKTRGTVGPSALAGGGIVPLVLLAAPTAVALNGGPLQATSISTGLGNTCAVTTSGGVKCWGVIHGQLGNNSISSFSPVPVDVSGLTSGVASISAGASYDCALTTSGGVKCWGGNYYGQLGNNSISSFSPVPVDVIGLTSGVASISAGVEHTCALTTSGGVKCWGSNRFGQLGNNSTTSSPVPVDVIGLTWGVASISTNFGHTCAVTTSGEVKCWGWNGHGQLGNNSKTDSRVPVDVLGGN